jgi:hypothetical protein
MRRFNNVCDCGVSVSLPGGLLVGKSLEKATSSASDGAQVLIRGERRRPAVLPF